MFLPLTGNPVIAIGVSMHRFSLGSQTDETDTARLAAAAARGDTAAFGSLYSLTASDLFGLTYLITFDEAAAAQAVAQAYSELLEQCRTGGPARKVELELLARANAAALTMVDDATDAVEAPISSGDNIAAIALARLNPQQRSALWLLEVLRYQMPIAAGILGRDEKSVRETIRQGRNTFRSSYAKSYSAGLVEPTHECASAQNLLVAYAGRNLNAGHTVAVEQHLGRCNDCRTTVNRLDDIEGRIRQVLVPVPAWLAQLAAQAVPMAKAKHNQEAAAPFAAASLSAEPPAPKPKKPSRREQRAAQAEEKRAREAQDAAIAREAASRRPKKLVRDAQPFLTAEPPVRVVNRNPRRSLLDLKAFATAAVITAVVGLVGVSAKNILTGESQPTTLARSALPTTTVPFDAEAQPPTDETVPDPEPPQATTETPTTTTAATAVSTTSVPTTADVASRAAAAPPPAAAPPAAPAPLPAPQPPAPPAPTTSTVVPSYELRRGVLPPTTQPPSTTTPPDIPPAPPAEQSAGGEN